MFFLLLFFKDAVLEAKYQENANKFVHKPNLRNLARDIVSIADCVVDNSHSNRNACEWGGALHRIALIYVQQAIPLNPDGSQREIHACGLTMGGSGHGSKYNTRIAYIPVAKRDKKDNPLSSEDFKFFDGYLVDWIEKKIRNGEPVATTKIRHDSGAVYDGCVLIVHEAQSETEPVELTKILMGLVHMLPYTTDPIGWYSNSDWATFVRVRLNTRNGDIEYRTCATVHNDSTSTDMAHQVTQTMTLIKHLAGILERKDAFVQGYMDARRQINNRGPTRDTPQAKTKTSVAQLDAQEGIFTMEKMKRKQWT